MWDSYSKDIVKQFGVIAWNVKRLGADGFGGISEAWIRVHAKAVPGALEKASEETKDETLARKFSYKEQNWSLRFPHLNSRYSSTKHRKRTSRELDNLFMKRTEVYLDDLYHVTEGILCMLVSINRETHDAAILLLMPTASGKSYCRTGLAFIHDLVFVETLFTLEPLRTIHLV